MAKKEKKLKKEKIKKQDDSTVDTTTQASPEPAVEVKKKKEPIVSEKDLESMQKLDSQINEFMSTVAKSKVAVIIPLYGYWSDIKGNTLNMDVLKYVMDRVYSDTHELYIILVAQKERLPENIWQAINARAFQGNVIGVQAPEDARYSDYINEGLDCALNETKAEFVLILNPWIAIQHGGIDALVNRINKRDVSFASGYDVTGDIEMEKFNSPKEIKREYRDLDLNFIAMTKQMANTIVVDPKIKTYRFTTKDILQTSHAKGFIAITTQNVPIHSFGIDWSLIENPQEYEEDLSAFLSKWGFNPQ
jgi:hypothetical protein